jgi:hypothetical protein
MKLKLYNNLNASGMKFDSFSTKLHNSIPDTALEYRISHLNNNFPPVMPDNRRPHVYCQDEVASC